MHCSAPFIRDIATHSPQDDQYCSQRAIFTLNIPVVQLVFMNFQLHFLAFTSTKLNQSTCNENSYFVYIYE